MLQLGAPVKNGLERIIFPPRSYVYALGYLQTIKCTSQLKAQVVTN